MQRHELEEHRGREPALSASGQDVRPVVALANGIRPAWEVTDPGSLDIELEVTRGGVSVWQASTSTSALYRRPPELVDWLFAEQAFPAGVVMAMGTGLVPEMDFKSPGG